MALDSIQKRGSEGSFFSLPVREKIGRAKYIPQDKIDVEYDQIEKNWSNKWKHLLQRKVNKHA